MPFLELNNVSKGFGPPWKRTEVLADINLSIEQGEFVAIMGQSGSGKSTLLNVLGCLDRPTAGTYRVNGIDVAGLSADELASLRRDTFGFVFQRYNLLANATALENVEVPSLYAGLAKRARWEHTWALQRREDAGRDGGPPRRDREPHGGAGDRPHDHVAPEVLARGHA